MGIATRRVSVIASAAVAIGALTAFPALAEGGFTSSASGWVTGKESRHWTKNSRKGSTSVEFSRCSVSNGRFKYAGIQFKEDIPFRPDKVIKRDKNRCDKSKFGKPGKGKYYFNYSNLNGKDRPRSYLNVKKISVKY
ncbi:MAG: hypothetical protein ACRDP3_12745 [Streptomyces sp.]|uniref:hypothetical protein n=1 Tax=Streptomyces sp. TaxID=1931 RepID=UPI003D6C1155